MSFRLFGRVIFVSKPVIGIIGVVILIATSLAGYSLLKNPGEDVFVMTTAKQTPTVNDLNTAQHAPASNETPPSGESEYIHVYVVGCVIKPGMIRLVKGQMIFDAVNKAGGLTTNADRENINMAYILTENMMLKILPVSKKNSNGSMSTMSATQTAPPSGKGVEIIRGIKEGDQPADTSKIDPANNKININTASAEELMTLPGIGEAKARDIMNYRSSEGSFKTIEEIMKIPGIKEARFKSIKDKICV